MIITYSECQIEITAEEVITLIDHFKTEVTTNVTHSIDPGVIINTDDEMPEPKPYPKPDETISPDTPEDYAIFSAAARRFSESEEKRLLMEDKLTEKGKQYIVACENTLEEAINGGHAESVKSALVGLDEAWYQAEQEIVPIMPAPKPKAKGRPKRKKVDVKFETGWKTFASASEAAEAIGVNYKTFYHNLTTGKPCKKHQIRFHSDMDEINEIMAEIEERNRKPYQTTPPVR
jgi:hypothetical protein